MDRAVSAPKPPGETEPPAVEFAAGGTAPPLSPLVNADPSRGGGGGGGGGDDLRALSILLQLRILPANSDDTRESIRLGEDDGDGGKLDERAEIGNKRSILEVLHFASARSGDKDVDDFQAIFYSPVVELTVRRSAQMQPKIGLNCCHQSLQSVPI
ncbi:hypothetical protein GUJ93_ZPchr0007g3965 [Zizania palustris]|uniref:Uncharacterized protein n=1 Tax=Zizania palustris TaxID=103762 RepID=A0A8J5TGN2_ZIZPA|nr:hypothetical protein GUJ93_ZPchr0007g3965 [Zizania palustris]